MTSRFWAYVRPHAWALAASLVLVAVVANSRSGHAVPDRPDFRHLLRASARPRFTIPFAKQFSVQCPAVDGTIFLALLVTATAVKAIAEYGSINVTAYLGQAVVRDLRNDPFRGRPFPAASVFSLQSDGRIDFRVSADVERIQTAASETLAEFLKQGAILIFPLIAIF